MCAVEYQFLNASQKRELNEIYASIVRKYKSYATYSTATISMDDAKALAKYELELKRKRHGFFWERKFPKSVRDALAKKIYADNKRVESASKARSLRDFVAFSNMKLRVPTNVQQLIEQEVYDAYFEWLLQFTPQDAYAYVNDNAIFYTNMGMAKFQELVSVLNIRRVT